MPCHCSLASAGKRPRGRERLAHRSAANDEGDHHRDPGDQDGASRERSQRISRCSGLLGSRWGIVRGVLKAESKTTRRLPSRPTEVRRGQRAKKRSSGGDGSNFTRLAKVRRDSRRDAWWVQPLAVFAGFARSSCTRRGRRFRATHLPMDRTFRRSIRRSCSATRRTRGSGSSRDGGRASLRYSPAFLILVFPAGFRFTCYYYRGALLQGVLGRSPLLHGRRAAQELLGRAGLPADPAKRPPLLPLCRDRVRLHPVLRRLGGAVVRRPDLRTGQVRLASARSSWPST